MGRDERDATESTPALSEETAEGADDPESGDALRRLRWERRQAWYEAMQRAEWLDALARRRWLRAHPPASPEHHGSRRDNLGTRLRLKARRDRAARLAQGPEAQKTEAPDE
jgi:hypothetical protein